MSEENKKQNQEEKTNEKCFHKGGVFHDTYREQGRYVASLGNRWASENFEATKPYFA